MKKLFLSASVVLMSLSVVGCGNMDHRTKSTVAGAGIGAATGAVLGNDGWGTVAGAAAGGLIGNQLGK